MTSGEAQPEPSDSSWKAGVIPYGGQSTAHLRMLELELHKTMVVRRLLPTVGIDGLSYVSAWGKCMFEIPADRPVHISVHVEHRGQVGATSLVLNPDQPATLDYSAPANMSYQGSLGVRGTTSARGRGLQGCLLVGLVVSLVLLVGFIAVLLGQAFG